MLSPIIKDAAAMTISTIVLWCIKESFEKYRKMNDFKKGVFAYASCEILGVICAVAGYALIKKSVATSVIMFATSALCVALTVYMFSVTASAVNRSTEAIKQTTEYIADKSGKNP